MEKVNSLEALKLILDGGIVESHERYYRYNEEKKEIQYSDYNMKNWKKSNASLDKFVEIEASWNVIVDDDSEEDEFIPNEKYTLHELGEKKDSWKNAVIVFEEGSFDKEFSTKERSYEIHSDAKYFDWEMGGNSLFGNCLDGKDNGVRLDKYIYDGWTVDYCYIVE